MQIIRFFSVIMVVICIIAGNVNANTNKPKWIVESITQGDLAQQANQTKLEINAAKRIIRQFEQIEEYNKQGRLIKRTLVDGSQEKYRYNDSQNMVSVWVTTADGILKEERTYLDKRLSSVLYADASLKTFQYPHPISQLPKNAYACQLFFYSGDEARLFQYDSSGSLISAFSGNGKKIPEGNLTEFKHISNLINPEDLILGAWE